MNIDYFINWGRNYYNTIPHDKILPRNILCARRPI